jgi:hypothetical protein
VAAVSSNLRKTASDIEQELIQVNAKATEDEANFPVKLNSKFGYVNRVLDSADAAPTAAEEAVFAHLDQQLKSQLAKWREVLAKDIPALNDEMRKNNIPLVAASAPPKNN